MQNPQAIIDGLRKSLQGKIASVYEVLRILDISPIMTEAELRDRHNGQKFCARIYRVMEPDHHVVFQAWETHAQQVTSFNDAHLASSRGLLRLGNLMAHVTEFTPAVDLGAFLANIGRMEPNYAIRTLLNLLQLLQSLYDAGGYHLNLTPRNILMRQDGEVVIKNFGLYRFEAEIAKHLGVQDLMDPSYLSPEHLSGKPLTVTSEIYQLGVMLYEMVVGQLPFHGRYKTIRDGHLNKPVPNPQAYNRQVSIGLARVLAKAMAKNPPERFWTLQEYQQTLSLLLPPEERPLFEEETSTPLSAAEIERLTSQVQQARQLFGEGDAEEAMKTVNAVLMINHRFEDAIKLGREIRLSDNQSLIRQHWDQSQEYLVAGHENQALASLHQILTLDPTNEQALGLQAQIFNQIEIEQPDLFHFVPVESFMERASVAKTLEEYSLAEGLLYQVLLASPSQESSYAQLIQLQKKMARRELEALQAIFQQQTGQDELGEDSIGITVDPGIAGDDGGLEGDDFDDASIEALTNRIGQAEEAEPAREPVEEQVEEETDELNEYDDVFDETERLDSEQDMELPFRPSLSDGVPAEEEAPLGFLPEDRAATQALPIFDPSTMKPPELSASPVEESEPLVSEPEPEPVAEATPPPLPPVEDKPTPQFALPPIDPPAPPPEAEPEPQPASTVAKPQPAEKGKSKAGLFIGIAALLFIVVIGTVAGLWLKSKADHKRAAEAGFQAAATLEDDGNWEQALEAWTSFHQDFPEHENGIGESRRQGLAQKIQERKDSIARYLERARSLIDQDILTGNGNENAVSYLSKTLELEADQAKALDLFEEIRITQLARANTMFSEGNVVEARELYQELLSINPEYRDQMFEDQSRTWLMENLINPGLAELDKSIQGKKWDEALLKTEELQEVIGDPTPLNERWDTVFGAFEQQLTEAEEKGDNPKMLAALEVMARIRPEDDLLVDRRNELSRQINEAKINGLVDNIDKNMKRRNYQRAGKLALQLKNLDSENPTVETTLSEVRSSFLKRINEKKTTNPREAVKDYNQLLSVFKERRYRTARANLKKRVDAFDGLVGNLMGMGTAVYDDQIVSAQKVLEQYNDFNSDPKYADVQVRRERLDTEKQQLAQLVDWEAKVRDDKSVTYASIVDRLRRENGFRIDFGKRKVRNLMTAYQDRIANYHGPVTILIRGAKKLPREKTGFNRLPDAFCELKSGSYKCATQPVNNNQNPTWDHTCSFDLKKGENIIFTIFDSESRGAEPLDAPVFVDKLPRSGKNLSVKSPKGWSITIDVRRER